MYEENYLELQDYLDYLEDDAYGPEFLPVDEDEYEYTNA
jgi:hypothetical protein